MASSHIGLQTWIQAFQMIDKDEYKTEPTRKKNHGCKDIKLACKKIKALH